MEIGARGGKNFTRILRLAGIPSGDKDVTVLQKGQTVKAGRKVILGWED